MSSKLTYYLWYAVALLVCIVPPAATVVYFFPLWVDKGAEATLSGFCLFLLVICAIPFFKQIRQILKNPSTRTIWLIGLIIFWSLSSIAEEMKVICFVGFIANLIGGFVFKIGDRYKEVNTNG